LIKQNEEKIKIGDHGLLLFPRHAPVCLKGPTKHQIYILYHFITFYIDRHSFRTHKGEEKNILLPN